MTDAQTTYTVLWRPVDYGLWMKCYTTASPNMARRRKSELQARWGGYTRVTAKPVRELPE